MDTLQSVDDNP